MSDQCSEDAQVIEVTSSSSSSSSSMEVTAAVDDICVLTERASDWRSRPITESSLCSCVVSQTDKPNVAPMPHVADHRWPTCFQTFGLLVIRKSLWGAACKMAHFMPEFCDASRLWHLTFWSQNNTLSLGKGNACTTVNRFAASTQVLKLIQ